MSEKASRNVVRILIALIVIAVLFPWKGIMDTWKDFEAADYRFDKLIEGNAFPIRHFDQHQKEFDLLVQEIDKFKEAQPNFFDDFTGVCYVTDEGLIFVRKGLLYPENQLFHKFTLDGSECIANFRDVFPFEFYFGSVCLRPQYQDYVFFCADERSWRFLVYTRGERPEQLIKEYREELDFVRVTEVAPGWYDFSP